MAGSTKTVALAAPVHGAVIGIEVVAGQRVAAGQVLLVLESMKMEVPLEAPAPGLVCSIAVALGDVVPAGATTMVFEPGDAGAGAADAASAAPPTTPPTTLAQAATPAQPRPALQALFDRRALTADAARPEAVAVRHAAGRRTARENVADLLDAGSFTEYGALAVAAQRSRRALDDLQHKTPADGLITGTGTVAGRPVAVLAYDYTVLAGTQGVFNHRKCDRLLGVAAANKLPVVLFAEGGGGRPGDVDWLGVAGLDCTTFGRFAGLSGQVPLVGIVAGRCFAGNAALLGCCDLIIACEGSSIGMGGPAMIEGGGLGRVDADAVGPLAVQAGNGVVDLRVADEAAAVAAARHYLALVSLPQGADAPAGGEALSLRHALPENRNALYDVRRIVETVMDAGSVLELRREFGVGVVTALARLGGRAVAVAASHPRHLGGALDAPACDKLARFMQLADAHGLPLISFVDTPGFMVGPASEATAMVRHAARLFVTAAALRVPVASVVLRRGYGLGAMALTAGHFHAPVATCAWPSGEFGAMGLEGAVRLGFRKELEAAPEGERAALFDRLLAAAVERGAALNMASHLEIDDVIDPAETRGWLQRVLASTDGRALPPRRAFIDPW
jgi:acetyl-CoA carboxylase carboxyltransferase component